MTTPSEEEARAASVLRHGIAQAIHDGPHAQQQYRDTRIGEHRWEDCHWQDAYLQDADAVVAFLADRVSTPPSEDWEYGWKYAQPLTQADWRTVYPYKVHQAMVQVRRRIVPQSEWEVVPASPAPLSSEYAAGPQGDAIRASKATTGSTAVPVLPTEPEMRMLMTHPHDGHGPNDTCRLCAPTEPEEKR